MANKRINVEAETVMEETLQAEVAPVKEQPGKVDPKDARIAELEARLQAAEKKAAGYRAGKDAEVVQQLIEETIKAGKSPWDVTVSVRVPERRDTTEKSYWMIINGHSCQVPADNQYHEMKLPFAETLMNQLKADKYAQNFAEKQIQVYDPIANPHPNK